MGLRSLNKVLWLTIRPFYAILKNYDLGGFVNRNGGKLFIISASSGAGKTTLVQLLLEHLKDVALARVITYTTKAPREKEVPGVDYHFLTEDEFRNKIQEDFFLEHSKAYGAYYGFPKYVLSQLENGMNLITIVDIDGARELRRSVQNTISIWIQAHAQLLADRLRKRGQDSQETIEYRLQIAYAEEKENREVFDYTIVNEDLATAVNELRRLILDELALQ
jgi:guanylate kinase